MEVLVYRLATLDDGLDRVERLAYELDSRYRRGETLADEELDWLDWANGVTTTANSQPVSA
jgi:hypothetical protein